MDTSPKKIVIIGPESTGKSTLSKQLADHYSTMWVPEYAREYLKINGTQYKYDDLLTIAKGQISLEDQYHEKLNKQELQPGNKKNNHPLLFVDTDMYVMKVWCEYVFGKCHPFILNTIAERKYDFYLLCNTDLQWVKDDLREYPDLETREKLFKIYKDILVNQVTPWFIVSGNNENRLQAAIKSINRHFNILP